MHFIFSLAWDGVGQLKLRYFFCSRWLRWIWSTQVEMHFVLAGMGWVSSTPVKMHFVCWHFRDLVNTSWDVFYVFALVGGVWSTHVKIRFVSLLTRDVFCQHLLRYILCPYSNKRNLVSTCFVAYCAPDGIESDWSKPVESAFCVLGLVKTCWECILCSRWCVRGLVNTRIGTFGLLTDIWGDWSTQMKIEIHLMSLLACDWFHQHKLRFILSSLLWERLCLHMLRHILCPRLHGSLGVWSTNVEMDLVSSLAWELFVQPLLRYMLSPRWHGLGLVNTS